MTLFGSLRRIPPAAILLGSMVLGALLLFVSFLIGLYNVTLHQVGTKGAFDQQVGYYDAVNWSLGFTLVAPVTLFFFLSSFQKTERVITRLSESHMLVDRNLESLSAEDAASTLASKWHRLLNSTERWTLGLSVVGILGSITEWWLFCGRPLLANRIDLVAEHEIDWSVAVLKDGHASPIARYTDAGFSLAAFTLQGLFLACLLTFFVFIFCLCRFVQDLADSRRPPILIPNFLSDDLRRGFEIFEGITTDVLIAGLCAYGLFYFSKTWNVFLRSDHSTYSTFIAGDIARGFKSGSWKGLGGSVFDSGPTNFSGTMVTMAAVVLFCFCLLIPLLILVRAAKDSRAFLLQKLDDGVSPRRSSHEYAAAKVRARLKNMKFWPMEYPKQNYLLVIVLFATVSIYYFRIGLFYIGILIALILQRVYRMTRAAI
jgi:hypothetical protein